MARASLRAGAPSRETMARMALRGRAVPPVTPGPRPREAPEDTSCLREPSSDNRAMRRTKHAFLAVALVALSSLPALMTGSCSAAGNTSKFTSDSGTGATGTGTGGTGTSTLSGTQTTGPGGMGGTFIQLDGGQGGAGGTPLMGDPTTCAEAATYKTYIGCDFWPTSVGNSVWSIFDFAAVVANGGATAADVTVTRNGSTIATATVQ